MKVSLKINYSSFGTSILGILLILVGAVFCGAETKKSFATAETKRPTSSKSRQISQSSRCRLVPDGSGPLGTDPVKLVKIVTGLEIPWGIAFLPSGNWLVTERPGRIRLIKKGVLQAAPITSLPVVKSGEGGLLGIAVHPQFTSNRYFYVYYTFAKPSGNVNRVERYRLSENEMEAVPNKLILDDIPAG